MKMLKNGLSLIKLVKFFSDRLVEILNSSLRKKKHQKFLNLLFKNIKRIFQSSLAAAIRTEMLPDKLQNVNYSNHKELTTLINEGQELNKLIDSLKQEWAILVEGKTKGELVIYKRKLET